MSGNLRQAARVANSPSPVTCGEELILSPTESVCPRCLARIPAQRVSRDGNVYLKKGCPEHGPFEVILWRGKPDPASWTKDKSPVREEPASGRIEKGCPFDCGLCAAHRQYTCCVLLEVTQRCNLQCAVCFADAGGDCSEDPGLDVIEQWYQNLLSAGGPFNIQLSGGEPTLRDDLPEIISLGRTLGFSFFQVNTNGLRLAEDPAYVRRLKEAGLSTVFLQFDGTEDRIYARLRGRGLLDLKKAAIQRCAEHKLGVVLVPTLVPGVNTENIGDIIDFALRHLPVVRGVHLQPISYFGRFPRVPEDENRITIPEILRAIEVQTKGLVQAASFSPPSHENAFCSFHGNFVLLPDGKLAAWTSGEPASCCNRKPEGAQERVVKAQKFVARWWSPIDENAPATAFGGPSLGGWDAVLERVRTHSLCISGMAFQDVWNLDLERLKDCSLDILSPDGKLVPFCAYNLTDPSGQSLYRSRGGCTAV